MPIHERDEKQQDEWINRVTLFLTQYFESEEFNEDEFKALQDVPEPTQTSSVAYRTRWCEIQTFFVLPQTSEYFKAKSLAKKIEALWPRQEEMKEASNFSLISMKYLHTQIGNSNNWEEVYSLSNMPGNRAARKFITAVYRLLYLSQSSSFLLVEKLGNYINPDNTGALIRMIFDYINTVYWSVISENLTSMLDKPVNEISSKFGGLTIALNLAARFVAVDASLPEALALQQRSKQIIDELSQKDYSSVLDNLKKIEAGGWMYKDLESILIRLSLSGILSKTPLKTKNGRNGGATVIQLTWLSNITQLSDQHWQACVCALLQQKPLYVLDKALYQAMPVYSFRTLLEGISLEGISLDRENIIKSCVEILEQMFFGNEASFNQGSATGVNLVEHLLQAIERLDYLVNGIGGVDNYQEIKAKIIRRYNAFFSSKYLDSWNRYQLAVYDEQTINNRMREISEASNEVGAKDGLLRMLLPKAIASEQAERLMISAMSSLMTLSGNTKAYHTVKAFIQDAINLLLERGYDANQLEKLFGGQVVMVGMLLDHPQHNIGLLKSFIDSHPTMIKEAVSVIKALFGLNIESEQFPHNQEDSKNDDGNVPLANEDTELTQLIMDLKRNSSPEQIGASITKAVAFLVEMDARFNMKESYCLVHDSVHKVIEKLVTKENGTDIVLSAVSAMENIKERALISAMLLDLPLEQRPTFEKTIQTNTSVIIQQIEYIQGYTPDILDKLVKYGLSSPLSQEVLAKKNFQRIWEKLTELQKLGSEQFNEHFNRLYVDLFNGNGSFEPKINDNKDELTEMLVASKKVFARYVLTLFAQHSLYQGSMEALPSCIMATETVQLLVGFDKRFLGTEPLSLSVNAEEEDRKHDFSPPTTAYTPPPQDGNSSDQSSNVNADPRLIYRNSSNDSRNSRRSSFSFLDQRDSSAVVEEEAGDTVEASCQRRPS